VARIDNQRDFNQLRQTTELRRFGAPGACSAGGKRPSIRVTKVTVMNQHYKSFLIVSLVWSLAPITMAGASPIEPGWSKPVITLRLYDYAEVPGGTLRRAQRVATQVFDRAVIETEWLSCHPAAEGSRDPACREPGGPSDFVLRIFPAVQPRFRKLQTVVGAAFAPPNGGLATSSASITIASKP